jgi:hypothetical protein
MDSALVSDAPPLSEDASFVVALAGTALPFAHSASDEAERWLRALRLQGEVGAAMQALGIGEAPLADSGAPPADEGVPLGRGAVARVAARASDHARARGATTAGTEDVLRAVIDLYDRLFDNALAIRGTTRGELLDRLASGSRF